MQDEHIGPYRVIRLIGQGGMGAVYEGVHMAIERRVAIKILHPEFARNRDFTDRFFNGMSEACSRRELLFRCAQGMAQEGWS